MERENRKSNCISRLIKNKTKYLNSKNLIYRYSGIMADHYTLIQLVN